MNSFLTFTHRWIGVALALFMLAWFSSGLIIAFFSAPPLTRAQQLAHEAPLAPEDGWLSLGDALRNSASARAKASRSGERATGAMSRGHGDEHPGKARGDSNIVDARLTRIDGAPIWLVEGDRGQRFAISAQNGELQEFSVESAERIARGWLEQDASTKKTTPAIAYVDTIDAPIGVRNAETLKPFHRFALEEGGGAQLLVSARTGEVVQITTRIERALSYAGNWLHLFHWLEPLGADEYRRDALTWVGFFAGAGALTGVILGWLRWRPGFFGKPTYARGRTQPYREFWFKYHFWAGLLGGSFALLWATSGFLSTNPGRVFSEATASREELARYRGGELPAALSDWRASASIRLGSEVVELGLNRLGDDVLLLAYTRDGARRGLTDSQTKSGFDEDALLAAVQRLAGKTQIASRELLQDYDAYYYPNRRQTAAEKPVPALRVDLADAGHTSVYIDPVDGRLLAKFDTSRRAYRWLYTAIHHWDFGWFQQRWLWNIWMAIWIAFGVALSASAVVLGWRRLRQSFGARATSPTKPGKPRAPEAPTPAAEAFSQDRAPATNG
jgi:uncharacterized iron-regulated membrane protein